MNYPPPEMWKRFEKIIVTGPQRSGTRICAKMLACDTGYRYVDETALQIDRVLRLWDVMSRKGQDVVQCPALCRYVHMFGNRDDVAIVLMRRNVADIIASEQRIGWGRAESELVRYDLHEGTIAEVKYRFWEEYQRGRILRPFEIEYESLAGHPLWIPKENRTGFGARQTKLRPQ